jgi:replicative DNA helicase
MDDTLQLTTYIIDGKHRSELMLIPKTTTLKEKASKLVNEHGVRVILIDYLELMEEYETVDLNAIIAKELGVQLIVLSSKLNIKR